MKSPHDQAEFTRRAALRGGIGAVSLAVIGARAAAVATASAAITTGAAQAQQSGTGIAPPPAMTATKSLSTTANTALSKEYVQMVGRFAYFWAWPMINSFNRRIALTSVPEPGLRGGVLPNAPLGQVCMLTDYISPEQRFVACPNQDVAYGFGFASLDEHPVVYQVPDFGDRFYVYAAWDARTDSFAEIGQQYGSKPGFYLLVGPNWKGTVPEGIIETFRSPTELAALCPRVFLNDTAEDKNAVLPILSQVMAYPLSEYDGTMKTKDWTKVPHFPTPPGAGSGEVKWVVPETFFDQLAEVLDKVPPLPGEETTYSMIRSVLTAAEKSQEVQQVLKETAVAADTEIIPPLFLWKHNGPAAGNGWYSPVNNADFGADYVVRTAVSKSNMYENRFNETKYIFTDTDAEGAQLDGSSTYTVTFPAGQLPPVDGFWSLTLYNEHHFFTPNPLQRFSLGTKNQGLQNNADGSLTIYAGPASPGKDKESNWLPAPSTPFSLYIRAYWPKQEVIDGSWKPPVIRKQ
ncbi:DUF1254 domain-containing protein [Rhizobium sp. 18055]|uniref:DUF1254 domain-containing protein n=1 Tax=Rhizobium sp. 18055 TaxID=2681403 RepID=UPI0013591A6A|nr:DUF1254 domain-containing protein [Rhizobium sp. 18055]